MKKLIWKTGLIMLCLLFRGLRAEASAPDVILKTEENQVEVTLNAPQEEAVSLQLALEVKVTKGNADTDVSFSFDRGIEGSVKEYRYDRGTGRLTLYLSGNQKQNLLDGGEVCLGKVALDARGKTAVVTVGVKTDSLQLVNRAYDLYKVGEVNASPVQKVELGEKKEDAAGTKKEEQSSGSGSGSDRRDEEPAAGGAADAGGGAAFAQSPSRVRDDFRLRAGSGQAAAAAPSGSADQPYGEDAEETETEDGTRSGETDPEEPQETGGSLNPKRKDRETAKDSALADRILLAALAAAGIAAGVVIFLMAQEYRRRKGRGQKGTGQASSRRKRKG